MSVLPGPVKLGSQRSVLRLPILPSICTVVLLIAVAAALTAPLLAPFQEGEIVTQPFAAPSAVNWLGGDFLGRDVLSRIIYGLRVTIGVGTGITALGFTLGSSLGFLSAVIGGRFDQVVSRIVDALISFPSMMIALVVIAGLGSSIPVLVLTVGLIDATRVYRVGRALAADIVVRDFVEVARLRGEKLGWIIFHEILPNTAGPLLAEFGIRFTYAILFISALSFLGLGVQPPHSDLGLMVKENIQGLMLGDYTPIYPALTIALITISVNLLVDWYIAVVKRTRR
ncbi:ABC transporter permease [Mesorhizobium sp. M00.F.Ca.ET.186.01.1.1]|nr:ABC transporter permease [bacterium M00.F.Ca.ET.205.01.1.1]TGU55166.1 ABC transporter permease [bacterium M00.F.Ca.ET.152.01.1.1]TGV40539.1 ABC transporter permease [Mesorhizobium sp. M00.F.Ca.ET.186.01.1.1]TGZ45542.1 ABC transporter permease [bacterium M00.F.Ca.ET.162.01.1.1]TIW61757.1 MAG: ABC transporter permease [Mesorhizobium sp.]